MVGRRRQAVRGMGLLLASGLLASLSCTSAGPNFFINNTVSLGGTTPGGRGSTELSIINNTQYFVSMTFGTYDPLDEILVPNYEQSIADSAHPGQYIEPGVTSPTFQFTVGRSVSLGDRGLIQAIKERDTSADESTLFEGITFSDKLLDDPGVTKFTINGVANQVQQIGINYQAGSLIIFILQPDATQPNGVRIDVDVALP